MRTKLSIAISAYVIAASAAMAAEQPPAHTGQFKPFVSAGSPPTPDGTLGMAVLSAVVGSDATIARGAGVTGGTHLGTGTYQIDFNRDVTGCTYDLAIGTTADGSTQGEVNVASRAGDANGIFVTTYDLTGAVADRSFHAFVFCAR